MKLTQLIGFIFIIIFVFVGCNNSSNKTSSTNNNSTRDILNDNDHSISIVALDQFCPETLENWLCNEILIHNSLNQIDYKVRYSWNLVDDNNINSTTIWLAGSDGQWSSEISRQLSPTLNKLTDHKIRSVIINFSDENLSGRLGTGGYFKALDGYVNAAKAYDLVVRHMIKEGIINGTHLTHVGGSNGSTIAMFALAYHKADEYLDQVIFNAGPQPLLIEESCFNEDSSYSFDSGGLQIGLSLRRLIDLWNGWSSQRYCEKNILPPQHLLDKTSLFSAGAQRRFPKLTINTIIGLNDVYGTSYLRNNIFWFRNTWAKHMTLSCVPGLGHEVDLTKTYDYILAGPQTNPLKKKDEACLDSPVPNSIDILGMVAGLQKIDNQVYLLGWSCLKNYYESITVKVFVNDDKGNKVLLRTHPALQPSEVAINHVCSTNSTWHRFKVPIMMSELEAHKGKKLFVYGIAPNDLGMKELGRSGEFNLPTTN